MNASCFPIFDFDITLQTHGEHASKYMFKTFSISSYCPHCPFRILFVSRHAFCISRLTFQLHLSHGANNVFSRKYTCIHGSTKALFYICYSKPPEKHFWLSVWAPLKTFHSNSAILFQWRELQKQCKLSQLLIWRTLPCTAQYITKLFQKITYSMSNAKLSHFISLRPSFFKSVSKLIWRGTPPQDHIQPKWTHENMRSKSSLQFSNKIARARSCTILIYSSSTIATIHLWCSVAIFVHALNNSTSITFFLKELLPPFATFEYVVTSY